MKLFKKKVLLSVFLVFFFMAAILGYGFFMVDKAKNTENTQKTKNEEITNEQVIGKKDTESTTNEKKWKISIPKIEMEANIKEGISQDIIKDNVGHFEGTSYTEGNICLAAHNRGSYEKYFKDINKLQIGDEIVYTHGKVTKTYIVFLNQIIEQTDLSCLKNSNYDQITLITCVEDMPDMRRCVKAKLKEEI